jgi:ATP-dependent DNA ligase
VTFPLAPPIDPMLAKLARELPRAPGLVYEPKWDGFRCLVFRDGDELFLQSRNARPLLRYFPELVAPLRDQLPERVVVDGELVVMGDTALDFDALQLRQHPADSRVQKLAREIPASYVAFDVLAVGDEVLLDTPFGERRTRLEALLADAAPPIFVTPATTNPEVGADWFARFEGAGFDGVVAKPAAGRYEPGKRVLVKVKHERTCDCAVAGYRVHKDGNGVGSVLLGLYDGDGDLHHVGVASSMDAVTRRAVLAELQPYRDGALDGHPWRSWAEFMQAQAEPVEAGVPESSAPESRAHRRMPGGPSRWNATKDLSWEPVRVELVAEVAYEGLLNGRFRHNARLRRLRPDRDPASCRYDQLETVAPAELRRLLASEAARPPV